MANFGDLARQYVLSDSEDEARLAARMAAATIEQPSANLRVLIAQWVGAINPWMPGGKEVNDVDDEDIVARAKALEFLASTLEILSRNSLKSDHVKLLITFFTSLFANDHRAGVTASAKALRQLVEMKAFIPSSGNDIIDGLVKLGDDFKRQTSTTRLEIYELILTLLLEPLVAEDISYKSGSTSGFMTALADLCHNERDPHNLLKWFEIQKVFLQNFKPSQEVAAEVFKSFSAYFPITLRASATPAGVTVDDLKGALRSCFASHHRIADKAIPFLIGKLDQGEAVTVSVKVDILLTIEACLTQYEDAQRGIAPFAEQIWASLKYEVRNGEILDAIAATLKTIQTLTKRLEGEDTKNFVSLTWRDLSDDLGNQTYTAQAGKLLCSIVAANPQAFSIATPQMVSRIKENLKKAKSEAHRVELLSFLNAILQVRTLHEQSILKRDESTTSLLQDELFGDRLFEDVYSGMWDTFQANVAIADQAAITKSIMEGIALLATQMSSGPKRQPLCSESIRQKSFDWLGQVSIMNPLEGTIFLQRSDSKFELELIDTATASLTRVAAAYSSGYQELSRRFMAAVMKSAEDGKSTPANNEELHEVASRLVSVGCSSATASGASLCLNFISATQILIEGLHPKAELPFSYMKIIIESVHLAILTSLKTFAAVEDEQSAKGRTETSVSDLYSALPSTIDGLSDIETAKVGDLSAISSSLSTLYLANGSSRDLILAYSLFIVKQVYRRFTTVKPKNGTTPGAPGNDFAVGLSPDFGDGTVVDVVVEDQLLDQVGRLAASVITRLSEKEQNALHLSYELLLVFHGDDAVGDGRTFRDSMLPTDAQLAASKIYVGVSSQDEYRTAPLMRGVVQGLWPRAMDELWSNGTFPFLADILSRIELKCSPSARVSLNTILTVLANKFPFASLPDGWERAYHQIGVALEHVSRRIESREPNPAQSLAILTSMLNFLSGDIIRFRPGQMGNWLLEMTYDLLPVEETMGSEFAQCMEVLVSPKECLTTEYHAITKRLRGQWIYHTLVQPKLERCFSPPERDERRAKNRAVSILRMLKHHKYAEYQSNAEEIVRIVIKSLTTFKTNQDMEAALMVLHEVLDHEPKLLQEHLESLIAKVLDVYRMAGNVRMSLEHVQTSRDPEKYKGIGKDATRCRILTLDFLRRLPIGVFEARYLLNSKNAISRGLALACGDNVREVRHMAQAARRAWQTIN